MNLIKCLTSKKEAALSDLFKGCRRLDNYIVINDAEDIVARGTALHTHNNVYVGGLPPLEARGAWIDSSAIDIADATIGASISYDTISPRPLYVTEERVQELIREALERRNQ